MLSKEDWMNIKAQRDKGVYLKDIAADLGVHPKTVKRALDRGGPPKLRRRPRKSKLDPYKAQIDKLLREEVWNCVVILRKIEKSGYRGEISILRDYVRSKRVLRQSRATVRFETEPGRQLQNDWGETRTMLAGKTRKVYFSVNTLGYSRGFHFWCAGSKDAEHTYEGLIRSFEYFGGVPRQVLVDNQGPLVAEHRRPHHPRFQERFLDLAGHYGFTPVACLPGRARTKGKVERMVHYIKHNFFQQYREFDSWSHLNALAQKWLVEEADLRLHGTCKEVVRDRLQRELPLLGKLPTVRYDTSYREQRTVGWDGYVDVRGNRYPVPDSLCGHTVTILIGLDGRLKVFAGGRLVAEHLLQDRSLGWVTAGHHHDDLWRETVQVQRRDLRIYAEVGSCN
jgi:transposase